MKEHAALVIAVLMVTSMAFAISATTVSAAHDQTPSIDQSTVKADTSMVLTITVANEGPDAIDNVRIIVPSDWAPAPTLKVPGDNTVELAATNNVVLLAGTKVKLTGATIVTIPENTELIRVVGDNVFYENYAGYQSENLRLVDNVRIKKNATVNATGLTTDDNVTLVEQRTVALQENDVVTLAETVVVRVTGNIVRLPENTMVKVHDDVNATGLTTGDNVTTEKEKTVVLDNGSNWVTQEAATVFIYATGGEMELAAGAWVRLWLADGETDENRVVLPAGSKVSLTGAATVELYENTEVRRVAPGATENIYLIDPASAENQPVNWAQDTGASALPPGDYAEWVGISDNQIASGASLDFPFAITTPTAGGDYTIFVTTTDTAGVTVQKEITLTVDNVPPTVTIAASPSWVKDNVAVTITVTASEKLAKLDNVMVAENNAPENTQVTMSSTDNITWTGTYTTGDNSQRDGSATIYVIGAQFEDLVGNTGSNTENTFTVDRMAPPTPRLTEITGFPADAGTTPAPGIQTKIATWLIENVAQDNFLGSYIEREGMTVKIRVGITVYTLTTPASGYYSKSITLTEGIQEVGIQYVDKAGNEGTENVENVTLDTTAPGISITSPADGAIIGDNTPLIQLTITDATLGVENATPFSAGDNSGYEVLLRRDNDNTVLATLTPITPPTSDPFTSFTFENQWPEDNALPSEVWYNIFVQAGDNLQKDNTYFRFKVDVTPPSWTATTAKEYTKLYYQATMDLIPTTTKIDSWYIEGEAREAGSTIKIYVDDTVTTATSSETANVNGRYDFSRSVQLSEGVHAVYFQEVDKAGNPSAKVLYGTYTVDKTAPVITPSAPAEATTTDAAQITISGTVTDAVVAYDQLVVMIDCTGASVAKTVYLSEDGSFSTTVPLLEGTNVISVVAKDSATINSLTGNQAIERRTVTRTAVTPWTTYTAVILVIIALVLAAIAIFRKR